MHALELSRHLILSSIGLWKSESTHLILSSFAFLITYTPCQRNRDVVIK